MQGRECSCKDFKKRSQHVWNDAIAVGVNVGPGKGPKGITLTMTLGVSQELFLNGNT